LNVREEDAQRALIRALIFGLLVGENRPVAQLFGELRHHVVEIEGGRRLSQWKFLEAPEPLRHERLRGCKNE